MTEKQIPNPVVRSAVRSVANGAMPFNGDHLEVGSRRYVVAFVNTSSKIQDSVKTPVVNVVTRNERNERVIFDLAELERVKAKIW